MNIDVFSAQNATANLSIFAETENCAPPRCLPGSGRSEEHSHYSLAPYHKAPRNPTSRTSPLLVRTTGLSGVSGTCGKGENQNGRHSHTILSWGLCFNGSARSCGHPGAHGLLLRAYDRKLSSRNEAAIVAFLRRAASYLQDVERAVGWRSAHGRRRMHAGARHVTLRDEFPIAIGCASRDAKYDNNIVNYVHEDGHAW